MPHFRIDDQVAFVTGAGSSIGQAITGACARSGAHVACCDLPLSGHDLKFEAMTPMGRVGRSDELAGPAVFLASAAASYCTGVDLNVDGGLLAC